MTRINDIFTQTIADYSISNKSQSNNGIGSVYLSVPSSKPIYFEPVNILGQRITKGELNINHAGVYNLNITSFGSSKWIAVIFFNNDFSFTRGFISFQK